MFSIVQQSSSRGMWPSRDLVLSQFNAITPQAAIAEFPPCRTCLSSLPWKKNICKSFWFQEISQQHQREGKQMFLTIWSLAFDGKAEGKAASDAPLQALDEREGCSGRRRWIFETFLGFFWIWFLSQLDLWSFVGGTTQQNRAWCTSKSHRGNSTCLILPGINFSFHFTHWSSLCVGGEPFDPWLLLVLLTAPWCPSASPDLHRWVTSRFLRRTMNFGCSAAPVWGHTPIPGGHMETPAPSSLHRVLCSGNSFLRALLQRG